LQALVKRSGVCYHQRESLRKRKREG